MSTKLPLLTTATDKTILLGEIGETPGGGGGCREGGGGVGEGGGLPYKMPDVCVDTVLGILEQTQFEDQKRCL